MFVWNVPNLLTIARLFTLPFILLALKLNDYSPAAYRLALIGFVAGGILDKLDGVAARKLNQETDFGKIWDPIVDKIWLHSIIIVLTIQHVINPYYMWLVVVRDLLVTHLRSDNSGQTADFLKAAKYGKLKFRTQVFYVGSIMMLEFTPKHFTSIMEPVTNLLMAISIWYSIVSGIYYFRKYNARV